MLQDTKPKNRIAFPLDVENLSQAEDWVKKLHSKVGVFKVGLQLFIAEGPDVIRMVHDHGAQCFLDLKLHDIPNTVSHAVESAAALQAEYLTVHTLGGYSMLKAAAQSAMGSKTKLLGVTILTSHDSSSLEKVGLKDPMAKLVTQLVRIGTDAGIHGFVCSPLECKTIRFTSGENSILVTPGIRRTQDLKDDQVRIATPTNAILEGADLLVVGRPIRHAKDPIITAGQIVQEIEQAIS